MENGDKKNEYTRKTRVALHRPMVIMSQDPELPVLGHIGVTFRNI